MKAKRIISIMLVVGLWLLSFLIGAALAGKPATHDVAVTQVSAPSALTQGDVVSVNVTVANLGDFSETFTVTLRDTTDNSQIGSQQVTGLRKNTTQVLQFSWNTAAATLGVHTLQAQASAVTGETNLANNISSSQVTVNPPVHDVATTSISAPASVEQGSSALINVSVANEGDYTETFDVKLEDLTSALTIGVETVTLAPDGSTTVPFIWTTDVSTLLGNHTLRATCGPVAEEADLTDNSKSTVVTIVAPSLSLISPGSIWKYHDGGIDLGTTWRMASYDDATWSLGPAQIGYGDGDEATVISYGSDPNNKYPCYYFRHSFNVADPSAIQQLTLKILRDDGAVVYINGTEVARTNMPSGTISYSTYASTAIGGADESTWYSYPIDKSTLVTGTNLMAVEVHQANASSTDVSFDLALTEEQTSTNAGNRGPAVCSSTDTPYDGASGTTYPTNKPRHPVWYYDNEWWAIFYAPDAAASADGEWHIFKKGTSDWSDESSLGNSDKADARDSSRPDVLLKGIDLWVYSVQESQAYIYKYSYQSSPKSWRLVAGYPKNAPGANVSSGLQFTNTFTVDTNNYIWLFWVPPGGSAQNIQYGYSIDGGGSWTTGNLVNLWPDLRLVDQDDAVYALKFNDGADSLGLVVSDWLDGYFIFGHRHDMDAPGALWQPAETIAYSTNCTDNHIDALADETNIWVANKTSLDTAGLPITKLYKRDGQGAWAGYTVWNERSGRSFTRPRMMIDDSKDEIYILACAHNGGYGEKHIQYVKTLLSNPSFNPDAEGTKVIDFTTEGINIDNVCTMKEQHVNATSGFYPVAVDNSTSAGARYYYWGAVPVTPPSVSIIKGPYLQNVTKNSITAMWETDVAAPSRVDYGLDQNYGSYLEDYTERTIHEIILSGLIDETTYHYMVSSSGIFSADNTFKTAPLEISPFSFVAYGDSRTNSGDHQAVVNTILTHNPQTLTLHSGDIVEDGTVYAQWQTQFFDPAKEMIKNSTLFPCLGNHENNAFWYYDFFSLPKNSTTEAWYSFNYGNSHFIVLNSNQSFMLGSTQYTWLENDLNSTEAANAKWIFVLFHHPPYSSGNHAAANEQPILDARLYLVPLFEAKGVDIVFNGHEHFYERSYKNGIYYIVTGGGGAPLGNINVVSNPYQQYAEKVLHHCLVNVTGDNVVSKAYRNDGTVLDSFSLGPVHDVAITQVSAPSTVLRGDLVTVDVTAANPGDYSESFTVTLTDITDGVEIGSPSINLAAAGSQVLQLNWDTTLFSIGNHTLQAYASPVLEEVDTSDNTKDTNVTVREPAHDVAVTNLDVPNSVIQGNTVPINVYVTNEGTYTEIFNVVLEDTTYTETIGTQSVILDAGNSTVVNFNWVTTISTPLGTHLLRAIAGPVLNETDLADNSKEKTLTVSAQLKLIAQSISISLEKRGVNWFAKAQVNVVDTQGLPVSGATVNGDWAFNGKSLNSDSQLTNAEGIALLTSSYAKAKSGDVFAITIAGVSKTDYIYDAAHSVTSASKVVP